MVSGTVACPITLPGYTGNGNSAASRRTHSNEWFNTSDYVEAYSNQAAGIATGGDVGLQIDDRPAHRRPWTSRMFKNSGSRSGSMSSSVAEAINLDQLHGAQPA